MNSRILRIELPIDLIMRLHEIKLFAGRSMGSIVQEALEALLPVLEEQLPGRTEPSSAAASGAAGRTSHMHGAGRGHPPRREAADLTSDGQSPQA